MAPAEEIIQCRRCGNVWLQPEPPQLACADCGAGPADLRREAPVEPALRRLLVDPRQAERR